MKFSIKDLFSKCNQIRSFLRIFSDLLNKFLMEDYIFCAVLARYEGVSHILENSFCSRKKYNK